MMLVIAVMLACTSFTAAVRDQGYGVCVGCSESQIASKSGCRDCVVDGEIYATNSKFSYTQDCYRFNCKCECDGSYTCPPKDTEYLCGVFDRNNEESNSGCLQCYVKGHYYPAGKKFSYVDDCYRLNCDCRCNGSYHCPSEDSEYLCGRDIKLQNNNNDCRQCIIHGQSFDGNTDFTLRNECIEYSRCRCFCSGEWKCFEDESINLCKRNNVQNLGQSQSDFGRTRSLTGNCRSCDVKGVLFPPNRAFDYRRGCEEMTGCFCACDGSYKCDIKRDICKNRNLQSVSSRQSSSSSSSSFQSSGSSSSASSSQGSNSGFGVVAGNSRVGRNRGECVVDGRRVDGDTYFKYTNNCIEYDACYCRRDGSWQCPAQRGRNICSGSAGSGLVVGSQARDGCQSCDVGGILRRGNSEFTHRNNCIEWRNCRCECDGSWSCLPENAEWICDNICRQCEIDGMTYDGNSEFRHQKDCVLYDPCMCNCDGSWDCPAENGKWVCKDRCLQCDVNGRQIEGNTNFTSRDDCWEWDPCICNCDGSWKCPKENAKWVCNDRCLECDVEGRKYSGKSQFQLKRGCFQYNCDCNCDGSWDCPANRTLDTCNMNVDTGCYYCNVHGEKFEGGSTFTHTDGCIRYDRCSCKCDGSWNCPGKHAVDTCRQNVTTGCYYCEVNGERIQGDSRFELEQNCWKFKCNCGCNGGWSCSASQASYICGTQVQRGQCRDCFVAGERYQTRGRFNLQWGCIAYNCQCNCDGSWRCPANNARIICSNAYFRDFRIKTISSVPSMWCRECVVNGAVYPGNSQFEYVDGCVKHHMRCYCDGGYRYKSVSISGCVPQAKGLSSSSSASKSVSVISSSEGCQQCVMNGQTHAARSTFEFAIGCISYICRCECSGIPSCRVKENVACGSRITEIGVRGSGRSETAVTGGGGSNTRIISSGRSGSNRNVNTGQVEGSVTLVPRPGHVSKTGSTIVTGGRRIPNSGTRISSTKVVVNNNGGVVSGGNGVCFPCFVEGQRYRSESEFDYVRGCVRYRCTCDCNGKAYCQPSAFEPCQNNLAAYCKPCFVRGQRYRSNERFELQRDCTILSCMCQCRGRPMCIRRSIPDCNINKNEKRCRECIVDGQRHSPNTVFPIQRDCLRYTCRCRCNGKHQCTSPVNVCRQPDVGCRSCVVNGISYSVNQQFEYQHGCWRLQCTCLCNGEYQCDRESGSYTCDDAREGQCRSCRVDGMIYPPDQKFKKIVGCYAQKCHCYCNGTHECTSTKENVCITKTRTIGTVVKVRPRGSESSVTRTKGTTTILLSGETRTNRTHNVVRTGSSVQTNKSSAPLSPSDNNVNAGRCLSCMVDGIRHAGKSEFFVDRRCKRYTCTCYCNGRYACNTGSPTNICDDQGRRNVNRSRSNNERRKIENARRRQENIDNVSQRQAEINERRRAENARRRQNKRVVENADRSRTKLDSDSDINTRPLIPDTRQIGVSESEGSSKRSGTARNVSRTASSVNVTRENYYREFEQREGYSSVRLTDVDIRRGRCGPCVINDRRYRGREEFFYDDGCKRFRCRCNCDGSWNCPRQQPQNTCSSLCRSCSLQGKIYPSESDFQIDFDECRKYKCKCDCSGQHHCYDVIDSCRDGDNANRERCNTCDVNGQSYPPNQMFQYRVDCTLFKCNCPCNGSYTCSTENVCPVVDVRENENCRNCEKEGRMYRTKSNFTYDKDCNRFSCECFCNGTVNCPASENICDDPNAQCRQCVRNNTIHQPRTRFTFTENCYRYNCYCNCDGSWNCPPERTENVCKRECTECIVNDRRYRGDSEFQYDEGCYRYTCSCSCDGSYDCPAGKTIDKCAGRCRHCEVDGKRFQPNRIFQYERGCDRYHCECRCNGSYFCPAERTENICDRGNERAGSRIINAWSRSRSGVCQPCEVEGRSYRPNARFRFDKNCYRFDCDCKCDGSWVCPPQRTQRSCREPIQRVPGDQCVMCEVENNRYEANADFAFDVGCYRYNCLCNCDGSWNCPADRTQDVCGGSNVNNGNNDGSDQCQQCHVYGNNYDPETRFQFTEGCYRFDCDCMCNGSWNCPKERTQKTCDDDRNVNADRNVHARLEDITRDISGISGTSDRSSSSNQRHSSVISSGGSSYHSSSVSHSSRQQFSDRNSSSSKSSIINRDSDAERERDAHESGCSPCEVSGRSYRPMSDFRYSDECHQYRCRCNCNGTTDCSIERSRPGCSQNSSSQSRCRRCEVKGRTYRPRSRFQYTDACERYDCQCNCDGSYNCPAQYTMNVCGENNGNKCKDCDVRGTTYSGNSFFVLREKCIQYKCQCKCDGRWECPDDQTVNLCNVDS